MVVANSRLSTLEAIHRLYSFMIQFTKIEYDDTTGKNYD